MFELPQVDDVLKQNTVTMRDLPARTASVFLVIGLSACHLPLQMVGLTAAVYLVIEIWGFFALRAIMRGFA